MFWVKDWLVLRGEVPPCISMVTASSSLSTLAVWASLMLPVPMSPAAENFTPSFVQEMTTLSPNWERSLMIL